MSEFDPRKPEDGIRLEMEALRSSLTAPPTGARSQDSTKALARLGSLLERLESRYDLLSDVLDRTQDIVFAKDGAGIYVMINPSGATALGHTRAEILGSDDRSLFSLETAELIMAQDRVVMATGGPSSRDTRSVHEGVTRTLRTVTTAWYDKDHHVNGVIGVGQDVTVQLQQEQDMHQRENMLRSMASETILDEARGRHQLATQLHDGLGQDLALAKLKLATLQSSTESELRETLAALEKLIVHADLSLRSITYQISPLPLYDLGLVPALQWLADDLRRWHGIDVTIEDLGVVAVDDEAVRVILFRSIRALLVDAARQNGTHGSTLSISSEDGWIRVIISDPREGFESNNFQRRGHGLFGLREQLGAYAAVLDIAWTSGAGTLATLTCPAVTPISPLAQ
ncbi:MAG: PAS domain-containing protein [Planctomycetes bacterium]|nr:PAS domain-containing protein [Planctomycetota bacterium]